uniref:Asp_protease domain-containing protein n=1 Tax=Heterorhabditis bacteriophora TaxID=37862 RepID=A0A1I7WGV0_HETBA
MGDVLALCASDLWNDEANGTMSVTKDGRPLVVTTEHLNLTLDVNFILINLIGHSSAASSKYAVSSSVPNVRRTSEDKDIREHARAMFTKMADPSLRGEIYFLARPLFDQYMNNPNDFGLNFNYFKINQALEHTPEAYIPVHMLYIRMEINGHPVKAFVDSGKLRSVLIFVYLLFI